MPANEPTPHEELNPYAPPRTLSIEEQALASTLLQEDAPSMPTALPVFRFWTIVGLGALLLCSVLLMCSVLLNGLITMATNQPAPVSFLTTLFFMAVISVGAYKSQQRKLEKFSQEYPDYHLSTSDIQRRCWLFLVCIWGMAIAEFILLLLVCVAACFGYFWLFKPIF